MEKKLYIKGIAVFVALTLFFQVVAPSVSWSLTGGPSQPEVNSFEPIGTTQMVDLASGDFTYNIPLLTIPGPNGGYPINLAYHAGIGMEQEASWVGLGWNINVGAINRQLRGIPDDFKGDEIERKINLKENTTFGFGIKPKSKEYEIIGLDFSLNYAFSQHYQIYYNNYRGVGISANVGFSQTFAESSSQSDKEFTSITSGIGISFDSQSGMSFSPSLSYGKITEEKIKKWTVSGSFHSRQGLLDISMKRDVGARITEENVNKNEDAKNYAKSMAASDPDKKRFKSSLNRSGSGAGVSFAMNSYVPGISNPMTGINGTFSYQFGKLEGVTFKGGLTLNAQFSRTKLKNSTRNLKGYGTMYLHNRHPNKDSIGVMDYNYENDIAVSKRVPAIPIPIRTHDMFSITGQGVGGVFRSFRSDIGILRPETSRSRNFSVDLGLEFGKATVPVPPPPFHLGVDVGLGYSTSYSGPWRFNADKLDYLNYQGLNSDYITYEPYFFKCNGEQLASGASSLDYINGYKPIAFKLGLKWRGISAHPMVHRTLGPGGSNNQIQSPIQTTRVKRSQNVEYRTIEEIVNDSYYDIRGYHIFDFGVNPSGITPSGSNRIDYEQTYHEDHHIAEVSVLNPDGNRYVYGLPAYNMEHKDVVFTIDKDHANFPEEFETPRTVEYDSEDASVNNNNGQDHYFSETKIPEYAHSYLLTAVLSSDYVDLTGNGPTEDDFGYYTKFNYSKENNDYKWRVPFEDANYSKGYYSNELDDKATYSYGKKELYYLNSVETKTHIAVFEVGIRNDAHGVSTEYSVGANGSDCRYLKTITLYSKEDLNSPLVQVHFVYSYELCQGVPNNDGANGLDTEFFESATNDGGKLTLKKVYFTHLNNDKGFLSPYEFDYNYNPGYTLNQMDRWGNYQPDHDYASGDQYLVNSENPFVRQEDYHTSRDNWATAWNLTQIILPSGGQIDIEYEQDDYGYVQDKRAMQMCRIVGVDEVGGSALSTASLMQNDSTILSGHGFTKLRKNNRRIYFEMETATNDSMVAKEYLNGVRELYFKVWEKLKFKTIEGNESTIAEDYVEGYARVSYYNNGVVKAGIAGDESEMTNIGYVEVEEVNYKKNKDGNGREAHPFRKAGWQYLKYQRPDLFFSPGPTGNDPVTFIVSNAFKIIREALTTAVGYYNYANLAQYCKEINFERKPSYLRLNSPDYIKYGGGCRVKKISMTDNWTEEGSSVYGHTYEYRTEDGKSSGVADYEPMVGGDENPFRKPVWYNGNDKLISFRHEDAYLEEPFGESLYPSANVVYSRVVVRNLESGGYTKSQSGIMVHEFYTARDFPTRVEKSGLEHKGYNLPLIIPFIGQQTFSNNGYSQGYSIILNDMSGKPKSVSTYAYKANFDPNVQPVSKVEYLYQTDPNNSKRLDNEVTVLNANNQTSLAYLGQTHEFYVAQQENSSIGINLGLQINLDVIGFPVAFAMLMPSVNYSESMYRSVATNKIIYQCGILQEVRNYTEGSEIITKNLMYDAETGMPLLTAVNNEHKKYIYTYSYPAHWAYENMGSAYQNIRINFELNDGMPGIEADLPVGVDHDDVFVLGDEILVNEGGTYEHVFVTNVTSTYIELEYADGTTPTYSGEFGKIIRSGRRNLQSVTSGKLVMLEKDAPLDVNNFTSWGMPQIVGLFNNLANGSKSYREIADGYALDNVGLCSVYSEDSSDAFTHADSILFKFVTTPEDHLEISIYENGVEEHCVSQIYYDNEEFDLLDDIDKMRIVDYKPSTTASTNDTLTIQNTSTGEYSEGLFNSKCDWDCRPFQILHADAQEFAEEGWTYNYADVGDPVVEGSVALSSDPTLNKYRYGQRGIWRGKRAWVYQVDRDQTLNAPFKTRANVDGEYNQFTEFDWITGSNPNWDWTTEITKYSPYGFELESKNALQIYSSEMYGYNNCHVTAAGSNARYQEIAFDGFEDYPGGTYASHGHLDFDNGGTININSTYGHTGSKSATVTSGAPLVYTVDIDDTDTSYFEPLLNKKYQFSAWVRTASNKGSVTIALDGNTLLDIDTDDMTYTEIDGWTKLEGTFQMPASVPSSGTFTVTLGATGTTYFDDVRISPFNGGFKSFVYDPTTLWLSATLDNLNYATFYNYDEQGNLTVIKKETDKGIVTIQTSRQNVAQ